MVKKKTEEYTFPDNSCGACQHLHIPEEIEDDCRREQYGVCYALPPICTFDGHDIQPCRPNVGWSEPACIFFKPRSHA